LWYQKNYLPRLDESLTTPLFFASWSNTQARFIFEEQPFQREQKVPRRGAIPGKPRITLTFPYAEISLFGAASTRFSENRRPANTQLKGLKTMAEESGICCCSRKDALASED